jgi:hypothetical protein
MEKSKISRRLFMTSAAGISFSSRPFAHATLTENPAGFPAPITAIPFGALSHWLQPWRELCGTISIDQIEAGIGVMIGGYETQQDALDMLQQHGFRHVRIEIGWGSVDPKSEAQLVNQGRIEAFFARLRQARLRPLILLNANDGFPCPAIISKALVVEPAPEGTLSLTLNSTGGLVTNRSGLQNTGLRGMASVLITTINEQQVALSRPLPAGIPAGAEIQIATMNYEPFSQPGTPRNERTILGWLRYVDLVAGAAIAGLGTTSTADRGFDLEIWNELTFGSRFLAINNYYDPKLLDYNPRLTWSDIVNRTATHVAAAGTKYSGVRLSDGFGATIPWPAASTEPPRVSAISRHPYPPQHNYPKDEQLGIVALDADGRKTTFIPIYKSYFPEYFANAIQTESLCRDLSNQTNNIGKIAHGRLSRTVSGQISPVDVWITEIGCAPHQWGITDPGQSERLMTTFTLRSLFFHLAIGVGRVYVFDAFSTASGLGLVNQSTPTVPSLPLLAIARILSTASANSDSQPPGPLTPLTLTALRNPADEILFAGNGSANLPSMTAADCLVLLPVQASPARHVIIYYVMTRDVRVPLEEQNLQVAIQGKGIQHFSATCYDPVTDQYLALDSPIHIPGGVVLTLSATDVPRLLVLT